MYKCLICKKEITNKGAYLNHINVCNLYPDIIDNIIYDYLINQLSVRDLSKKYNVAFNTIRGILGNKTRSLSDANKIAHKLKPRTHTSESKSKIREARLNWMKENPDKTAWRQRNLSYPEKRFQDKIKDLNLDNKHLIIRERSVFPYFIDFAFENEKVAVEIDGSQHELEQRKSSDEQKDQLLISQGWRVYRVSAKAVNEDIDNVMLEVLDYLLSSETHKVSEKVGIYDSSEVKRIKKEKVEKERNCNGGLTEKESKRALLQRKVERPPFDQLIQEVEEFGYLATGRKYGVSDNSIRKWIKWYQKQN
jgi:very-short-patch-repair endonuclease